MRKKAVKYTRKLTDEECIDVHNMKLRGCSQREIGDKYNLSKSTVSCIINKADYYKKVINRSLGSLPCKSQVPHNL